MACATLGRSNCEDAGWDVIEFALFVAAMAQAAPPAPVTEVPSTRVETFYRTPPEGGSPSKLLNAQEIFTYETYPYWARENWEEGTVFVRVQLTASGAVISCEVTHSSGSALLDIGTCDLITERGRFEPKRDKNGKAVATTHATAVTWTLAQDELWRVEDSPTRVVYSVGPNSFVTDCRVEGDLPDDPRTCAELRATAQTMVVTSPPNFDWKTWDVVIETSDFAGAGDKAMAVGKREGEMLFDRQINRKTISPEGRVKRCEVIESATMFPAEAEGWCEKVMASSYFEPAAGNADRLLTSVTALYLRKKW